MSFKPVNDGIEVVRLKETFPFTRERQASDTIAGAVSNITIAQVGSNGNNTRNTQSILSTAIGFRAKNG